MAQQTVVVPGIGEILLAKRRGAKNIRLSITAAGIVRVGLPHWAPYAAGVAFAKSRSEWIAQNLQSHSASLLKENDLIGKSHRLHYKFNPKLKTTTARVTNTTIEISSALSFAEEKVQAKARHAAEAALKKEAENLLVRRLEQLAKKHNFSYSSVRIRKLTSRWGSCSHGKSITLSHYLMQLPWRLIDYVLAHELVHTEYLNHSANFWERFCQVLPDAKKMQKEIRNYKPRIKPTTL